MSCTTVTSDSCVQPLWCERKRFVWGKKEQRRMMKSGLDFVVTPLSASDLKCIWLNEFPSIPTGSHVITVLSGNGLMGRRGPSKDKERHLTRGHIVGCFHICSAKDGVTVEFLRGPRCPGDNREISKDTGRHERQMRTRRQGHVIKRWGKVPKFHHVEEHNSPTLQARHFGAVVRTSVSSFWI